MLARIKPKSKRAKQRVKDHGETMLITKDLGHTARFQSLRNTWRGEVWVGWFTQAEASWEIQDEIRRPARQDNEGMS